MSMGNIRNRSRKKTDTLYWKTSYDSSTKKTHYYRINDSRVDSTETLEGYQKVKFISDAHVEFGKYFEEFVSHGKKNERETLYYAQIGMWLPSIYSEISFSYADGTAEMNAGHRWYWLYDAGGIRRKERSEKCYCLGG